MTELLGRKLSSVLVELKRENRETVVVPTSSKKGSGGSDTRVIRVRELQDGKLELTVSDFLTAVQH